MIRAIMIGSPHGAGEVQADGSRGVNSERLLIQLNSQHSALLVGGHDSVVVLPTNLEAALPEM